MFNIRFIFLYEWAEESIDSIIKQVKANGDGFHYAANGINDKIGLRQQIQQILNMSFDKMLPLVGSPATEIGSCLVDEKNIPEVAIKQLHIYGINTISKFARLDQPGYLTVLSGQTFIWKNDFYQMFTNALHAWQPHVLLNKFMDHTSILPPTSQEVGKFVDEQTAGSPRRDPAAVVGRAIEELVETALEIGVPVGQIFNHVIDSVHNQSLKLSRELDKTVFPSEFADNKIIRRAEIATEIADTRLVLKDLQYILEIDDSDLNRVEADKWQSFIKKEFNVSRRGCLYAKKSHIK
jgi:hypothetical protein